MWQRKSDHGQERHFSALNDSRRPKINSESHQKRTESASPCIFRRIQKTPLLICIFSVYNFSVVWHATPIGHSFFTGPITGPENFTTHGNQTIRVSRAAHGRSSQLLWAFLTDFCHGQTQPPSCDLSSLLRYHSSRVQKVKGVQAMADTVNFCK